METLTGSVERITYYNSENGYSVVRLRPRKRNLPGANREGMVTVVGNLPELSAGEYLRLKGQWVNDPKFGAQFKVEVCEQALPATVNGIRRYLGSGLIKGIGPKLAERIVDQFGAESLEVIENEPERLREVPDIGPKRSRLIAEAWEQQRQVKDIMLFLHSHGVTTNLAVKIYKEYGQQSMQIVKSDPYRLATDIYGVGFKTADGIARALGLPLDHPTRLEAGLLYVLDDMSRGEGHVFTPREELISRAVELLGVDDGLLPPAIERLVKGKRAITEVLPFLEAGEKGTEAQTGVYLSPLYHSEVGVARQLRTLASCIPSNLSDLPPAFLRFDDSLSPEQTESVRTALTHPVSVLTGGPGTGKTTTIKALIAALEQGNKSCALASPTGRAAKRLAEAAGRPASTIHRLLKYSPRDGFQHNEESPLEIDFLVVDEASMLDLHLAYALLRALSPGTHLLLVGDVDQLPSVGAGDVLRDVIASEMVPVTRLSVIFRQAAGSQIIANAHRINQGENPIFSKEGEDFFFFSAERPEEAAQWVKEVVAIRIPRRFGIQASDIQVLAPMYRGPAGVHNLNATLQETLNPPGPLKPERSLYGQIFRKGDRVMQVKNNYDKAVFNGDIGKLRDISITDQSLTVEIDGRPIEYDWSEADQLVLAYAASVHKAQGSEFPAVVVPLLTSHYMMLQRNLLYTAITRAKKLCVLVGSRKAIAIAVRNNKVAERYTALDWRLSD